MESEVCGSQPRWLYWPYEQSRFAHSN